MYITADEATERFGLGATVLEWDDVKDKENEYVWTYLEGDDTTVICSGFHYVNRIGYYLSEKPVPDGEYYEVPVSRDIECEQCQCKACQGTGVDGIDKECEDCHGSGAEEDCGNCLGSGYRTEWY
jgi:RecJ-like exonuclease